MQELLSLWSWVVPSLHTDAFLTWGTLYFRDFYGGSSRGHGPLLILSPEVEGFKLLITAWSFR